MNTSILQVLLHLGVGSKAYGGRWKQYPQLKASLLGHAHISLKVEPEEVVWRATASLYVDPEERAAQVRKCRNVRASVGR